MLVGTAVLTLMVALDGDSTTTYMIAIAAFLPLYQRLGMSVLGLTCLVNIASGVMNLSPWGGPRHAPPPHCALMRWTFSSPCFRRLF
nr:SLC13 family permease [Pectobacterium colocasium]